jgi:glycosyltransferase involved in cell wall biosynthesis
LADLCLRILHCIWSLGDGGAERQLAILAPALASRGHDIHVAYVYSGPNVQLIGGSSCSLHQIDARHKHDMSIVSRVFGLVHELRPEIIQTWMLQMDLIGGAAARFFRRPWVLAERSSAMGYPPSALNRLRLWSGRAATAIVANSDGGAAYWAARGVDHSKITIVGNALNVAEIDAAEPAKADGLGPDDEVILFVGRLRREKNVSTLLRAVAVLARSRPRVKLVLCGGDGGERAALEAQARERDIAGRVLFTGFTRNVGMWLKRASVMAAVSLWEGHPNAVLESIAAGLPVVVSDIPAYRAILDDACASFVPPLDENELAAALGAALSDRQAASRRALEARRRLQAQSADVVAARYEQLYGLIASSKAPSRLLRPIGW